MIACGQHWVRSLTPARSRNVVRRRPILGLSNGGSHHRVAKSASRSLDTGPNLARTPLSRHEREGAAHDAAGLRVDVGLGRDGGDRRRELALDRAARGKLRLRLAGDQEESRTPAALPPEEQDSISYLTAVVRGKRKPSGLSSLENNMIVTEILEAARESARTGQTIKLH